jgi:hypothetical protein
MTLRVATSSPGRSPESALRWRIHTLSHEFNGRSEALSHHFNASPTLLSSAGAVMAELADKTRLLLAGHRIDASEIAASRSAIDVESHKISKSTGGFLGIWAKSESLGDSVIVESKNRRSHSVPWTEDPVPYSNTDFCRIIYSLTIHRTSLGRPDNPAPW